MKNIIAITLVFLIVLICISVVPFFYKKTKMFAYKNIRNKLENHLEKNLPGFKIISESDFIGLNIETNQTSLINLFYFSSECHDLHRIIKIILENFEKIHVQKDKFSIVKESNSKIISVKHMGIKFLIAILKKDHKFLIRIEALK